jgi:hypothetical protein
MLSPSASKIACREIASADFPAVVDLLARGYQAMGFPAGIRHYWARGLDRLTHHATPEGLPRYGYVLESDETIVGAVLTIFSKVPADRGLITRCNIAGIYVDPAFKTFAGLLRARSAIRTSPI